MKKLLFVFLFFVSLTQIYADLDFTEAPSQTTCAALGEAYLYGQPIFSNDGLKLYYVAGVLTGSDYTYHLKYRPLTNVFDCSSYSAAATSLYSIYANGIARIIEYENFIYLIRFSTSQGTDLYRFDLQTNTLSAILYNNLTSSIFHLDLTNGNLYLNTSSGNVLIYNVSGGGFESIGNATTASMPGYTASYIYDDFLYSSNTLNPLSINKYQIINTAGVFSFNLVNNFSFTGNFSGFPNLFAGRSLGQNYFYYLYNSGSNIINQKIGIINNYTPPTEFNLAYIQSQPPQQLYSGFKTYIQSIYDIDTGNDITNNIFYYIEYLTGTGAVYPLTTSNFSVGLTPQTVTFPYHSLVGDYKATAKFLFNDLEYDLFEFNYSVIQAASPGDAQTDNCNFFDYNCDGEVGILNGEFLKALGAWVYTPIDYILTYIGKVKEFIGSLQDIFTIEEKTIGFFEFVPKAEASAAFNPFNNLPSEDDKNIMTDIMKFAKGFVILIFLVMSLVVFIAINKKRNE